MGKGLERVCHQKPLTPPSIPAPSAPDGPAVGLGCAVPLPLPGPKTGSIPTLPPAWLGKGRSAHPGDAFVIKQVCVTVCVCDCVCVCMCVCV